MGLIFKIASLAITTLLLPPAAAGKCLDSLGQVPQGEAPTIVLVGESHSSENQASERAGKFVLDAALSGEIILGSEVDLSNSSALKVNSPLVVENDNIFAVEDPLAFAMNSVFRFRPETLRSNRTINYAKHLELFCNETYSNNYSKNFLMQTMASWLRSAQDGRDGCNLQTRQAYGKVVPAFKTPTVFHRECRLFVANNIVRFNGGRANQCAKKFVEHLQEATIATVEKHYEDAVPEDISLTGCYGFCSHSMEDMLLLIRQWRDQRFAENMEKVFCSAAAANGRSGKGLQFVGYVGENHLAGVQANLEGKGYAVKSYKVGTQDDSQPLIQFIKDSQ